MMIRFRNPLPSLLILLASATPVLGQAVTSSADRARDTGVSALWILANFSYAGMRAQNSRSAGWRIIAFVFGFPGTLISLVLIGEGSERAYGVDVPRSQAPPGPTAPH